MNILRTIKHLWWVAALMICAPSAWGFALLGPLANGGDSWQTGVIGYGLPYSESLTFGGPVDLGDIGGPKNIGEGYRRNVPVIYYGYDAAFLDFFGSNGVAAADSAVSIMNFSMTNNSLGNLDGYSAFLTEFPPESLHLNYEAQSLGLTDVKSVTLHLLLEQLGLAEPERYTWTLAERFLEPPLTCPLGEEYLVIQRNYSPGPSPLNQVQYSAYVNDTLYSYYIDEICSGINPLAVTVPFNVDPNADTYTAVAANNRDGLGIGGYYTGLTRDDMGGLRYLYTSNNIVYETPTFGANGTGNLISTNIGAVTQITSSNLTTLLLFSETNNPGVTASTFGVTITATNIGYGYVTNWTYTSTLTSPNGSPVGTQILTVVSNPVVSFQTIYTNTFGNVITNGNETSFPGIIQECSNTLVLNYSPTTTGLLETTSLSQENGAPYGTLTTNTTVTPVTITYPNGGNVPSGEYITLPNVPNGCGFVFLCISPIANMVSTTNFLASTTNAAGFVGSQYLVTTFTSHTYLVEPLTCPLVGQATNLYEGIEKVQFVKADFDSLVGQFFNPVTNDYTMVLITNSQASIASFQRIVTGPDILMDASDQVGANTFDGSVTRDINFNQGTIDPGLAGPGVIDPVSTLSFNKMDDAFENSELFTPNGTNAFAYQYYQIPVIQWGSFDGTTNEPVLYPNGTSIQNLQNQVLVQVSPTPPALPNGTRGSFYSETFTASGGAFNYPYISWSVVAGLGSLPPGLSLSSSGVLSGTPTQTGSFDFTVQMTDSLGRSVSWFYTLVIN